MIDMEEDAEALPSNDRLLEISALANEMIALEAEIDADERVLAEKKDRYNKLALNTLPEVCQAAGGLTVVKLSSGFTLEIKPFVDAKIPEKQQAAAFAWLRDNGHDDIIKNELVLTFGRGDDKKCETAKEELTKIGLEPAAKTGVHPQTLKAFVRERMESGQPVPADLFGVFSGNKAKITSPKGARKK